jgi:hypothetical protein
VATDILGVSGRAMLTALIERLAGGVDTANSAGWHVRPARPADASLYLESVLRNACPKNCVPRYFSGRLANTNSRRGRY